MASEPCSTVSIPHLDSTVCFSHFFARDTELILEPISQAVRSLECCTYLQVEVKVLTGLKCIYTNQGSPRCKYHTNFLRDILHILCRSLWGIGCAQLCSYFNVSTLRRRKPSIFKFMRVLFLPQKYGYSDQAWFKIHILAVWVLDTALQVLMTVTVYVSFIRSSDSSTSFHVQRYAFDSEKICNGLIAGRLGLPSTRWYFPPLLKPWFRVFLSVVSGSVRFAFIILTLDLI